MLTRYKTHKRGRIRGALALFFMAVSLCLAIYAANLKLELDTRPHITHCTHEDAIDALSVIIEPSADRLRLVPLPKRKPS